MLTRQELLAFMRSHAMAVQASVSAHGAPQAAVVGFVVNDRFEVFFDTLDSTRKLSNLRQDARIALVIGGLSDDEEQTVQYEGLADEPQGAELDSLKALYFRVFPEGRERQGWPGLTYVRTRPLWLRYSDFDQVPPLVVELTSGQLEALT
ncbi:MAG TPA: pyridoxamine 5'-phosphate oxidase family protein [Planctomycetota bacterium]|nr:pyridoxamine 5'-phosphate oxidase family protein [Planctomycetota bacterium]